MGTYKGGYKFSNGLPMSDEFKKTMDKFYEYSKAQGETRSRQEVFALYEKLIMDAAGIKGKHYKLD